MGENLIVINADLGETRVALVEDGIIVELLLERRDDRSIVGNIYRGKVTRVLPGMQAAFVDIGLERHAFLHASDLVYENNGGIGDDSHKEEQPEKQKASRFHKNGRIQEFLKEGEFVVVQVSKGPISTKGARVTAEVSLPGRHLVYMPMSNRGGVSRRIPDEDERRRLSKALKYISPEKGALIARTAAQGASTDSLAADVDYLVETWKSVVTTNKQLKKPGLLYEELDLPLRVARDRLDDSIAELVVDDKKYFDRLHSFVDRLIPSCLKTLKLYDGDEPVLMHLVSSPR